MPMMEEYSMKKTSVREHERTTSSGKKTTVRKHDRKLKKAYKDLDSMIDQARTEFQVNQVYLKINKSKDLNEQEKYDLQRKAFNRGSELVRKESEIDDTIEKNKILKWIDRWGELDNSDFLIEDIDDNYLHLKTKSNNEHIYIDVDDEGNYFAKSTIILDKKPHGLNPNDLYDDYEMILSDVFKFIKRYESKMGD